MRADGVNEQEWNQIMNKENEEHATTGVAAQR